MFLPQGHYPAFNIEGKRSSSRGKKKKKKKITGPKDSDIAMI